MRSDVRPAAEAELRGTLRDIIALTAIPALWAERDPQSIVDDAAALLTRMLDAEVACVSFGLPGGETLQSSGSCGPATAAAERAFTEVQRGPRSVIPVEVDTGESLRLFGMPLGTDPRTGWLVVGSRRQDFPTESERTVLEVAASQAAVALRASALLAARAAATERERAARVEAEALAQEKAALLGQVQERMDVQVQLNAALRELAEVRDQARAEAETLYRVGQALSAELDLEKLVQAATDAATELSGAQFGAFFYNRIGDRGEEYMLYTLSGAPREAFQDYPMPRNTEVFEPTFRGTEIVRSDDITRDPRYGKTPPHHGMPPGHPTVRSYLAVPVASRSGKVLGGMFFGHSDVGVFSERAERLAAGIAAQAAIAIDNAHLYGQVQHALRSRDEFLSSAAHDLKTPLTTIKGLAQLLRRQRRSAGATEGGMLTEGLATIDVTATHMSELLDELADLTRTQMGQPLSLRRRPTDLVELVRQVVSAQQQTTERHHLHLEVHAAELTGEWDAGRLARLLNNLLDNAIKYSPDGGDVTVTVTRQDAPDGTWAVLQVRDAGIGIPASELERVFERFQRASNVVGRIAGAGVGLASARQVVEQHGGTITVQSSEGAGSTFTVRLPVGTGEGDQ